MINAAKNILQFYVKMLLNENTGSLILSNNVTLFKKGCMFKQTFLNMKLQFVFWCSEFCLVLLFYSGFYCVLYHSAGYFLYLNVLKTFFIIEDIFIICLLIIYVFLYYEGSNFMKWNLIACF